MTASHNLPFFIGNKSGLPTMRSKQLSMVSVNFSPNQSKFSSYHTTDSKYSFSASG